MKDAQEYINEIAKEAVSLGHTWDKEGKRPYGNIVVPAEGLVTARGLVMPMRMNLIGSCTAIHDQKGIVAGPDFPFGEPILQWKSSKSQGNFAQSIRDVQFRLGNRANGPLLTGDNGSNYSNVMIERPYTIGYQLRSVTHGAVLNNLIVEGVPGEKGITGFHLKDCRGLSITGMVYNALIGIRMDKSAACSFVGSFEHVIRTHLWTRCIACRALSECSSCASDGLLAEMIQCSGCRMEGGVRRGDHYTNTIEVTGFLKNSTVRSANKNGWRAFKATS